MKKTRRIAAMIAALAMAATMAVSSVMMSASATNVSVDTASDNTVTSAAHTYTAYPIFTGTYDADLGLTVGGWAEGYNFTSLLSDADFTGIVAIKAQAAIGTVGEEGYVAAVEQKTIGQLIGSATDAATIAQALEKIGDNSTEAAALAKVLAKYTGASGTKTLTSTATALDAGYWLVKDTYTAATTQPNVSNDATSAYVLRVSGGSDAITITPKKDKPTVEKKVKENVKDVTGTPINDASTTEKWNDVADYNIGDSVPFKLYGTLPDETSYAAYEHYYYKFTDTLGTQFDAPTAANVTVKVNGTTISNESGKANMRVDVTGQVITVSFEDIKEFAPNATDVITVEYSAVLNNTAVIGLNGQENKVDLTYSNNPNSTYSPNIGDTTNDEDTDNEDKTPEDKVIVFTYELDVTKEDAATQAKLEGAEFVLYRGTGENTEYAVVTDGKISDWLKGTLTVTNGTVSFTKTNSANNTAATAPTALTSNANGLFTVAGLDDGTYFLKETKAPTNYNLLTSDIALTISAETVNNQTWNGTASTALTALTISVTDTVNASTGTGSVDSGIVPMTVKNAKGTALPSTGGMGTILFYTVGGILVIGAGVVLVTKKRSKNEQ